MIKYKKINKKVKDPVRSHPTDAGIDLFVNSVTPKLSKHIDIPYYLLGTGIKVAIPEGYFGLRVARSSTFKNYELQMTSPGIIDSSYRGEIMIPVRSAFGGSSGHDTTHLVGKRIAQLIIVPCVLGHWEEVETLEDTARGEGGFGSSDEIQTTTKN